jgi:hypothetical protein
VHSLAWPSLQRHHCKSRHAKVSQQSSSYDAYGQCLKFVGDGSERCFTVTANDRRLFWKHRVTLTDNKKALMKLRECLKRVFLVCACCQMCNLLPLASRLRISHLASFGLEVSRVPGHDIFGTCQEDATAYSLLIRTNCRSCFIL